MITHWTGVTTAHVSGSRAFLKRVGPHWTHWLTPPPRPVLTRQTSLLRDVEGIVCKPIRNRWRQDDVDKAKNPYSQAVGRDELFNKRLG